MADHRIAGQATIDAARRQPLGVPELLETGLEPWDGVRHLAVIACRNRPTPST